MKIFEIYSKKTTLRIAQDFTNWACDKLVISNSPKIRFTNDKDQVKSNRTFGSTNSTGEIWVYMGDRNTADVLRTLCHELVHFKQFDKGTATNSMNKQQHQKIEDEANAIAGRLMREYGKHNVEIYEWHTK
jgi:Zn-dependent peptidase ImmA (M78 family)